MVHLDTLATAAHSVCREIVLLADKTCCGKTVDMDEDMRNCLSIMCVLSCCVT